MGSFSNCLIYLVSCHILFVSTFLQFLRMRTRHPSTPPNTPRGPKCHEKLGGGTVVLWSPRGKERGPGRGDRGRMLSGKKKCDEQSRDLVVRVSASILVLHVHEHLTGHQRHQPAVGEATSLDIFPGYTRASECATPLESAGT